MSVDLAALAAEQEVAVRDLLAERLGEEYVVGDGALKVTGLEVLAFLAAQAVLPIVVNVVSSELDDLRRRIRTRKDAARAHEALRSARPASSPAVAPAEVQRQVIVVLVAEGVPESLAEEIARRTQDAVQTALRTGS